GGPTRARHAARVPDSAPTACAVPARAAAVRVVPGPGRDRRAVLRDGAASRTGTGPGAARGLDHGPRKAFGYYRVTCTCAGGPPRGGLASGRTRRGWSPGGLHAAPGQRMDRSLSARADRRRGGT